MKLYGKYGSDKQIYVYDEEGRRGEVSFYSGHGERRAGNVTQSGASNTGMINRIV